MSPDKLSELYRELKEKYKDNPEGILEEYKGKYQKQDRFIRYSKTLWCLVIVAIIGSMEPLYNWLLPMNMLAKIILGITVVLLYGLTMVKVVSIIDDYPKKFPRYDIIKSIYKDAYLHSQYTQFTLKAKREEIESKWILIRWWRERKFYGI